MSIKVTKITKAKKRWLKLNYQKRKKKQKKIH